MVQAGAHKTKRRGRGKAPRGRGATTGRVESKERGKGSREKETGEETDKASRGREMLSQMVTYLICDLRKELFKRVQARFR